MQCNTTDHGVPQQTNTLKQCLWMVGPTEQLTPSILISMEDYATTFYALSPSGWNRFQPQIDTVLNRGTFLLTVISKTCPRIIRSKKVFFRISNILSTRSHAQLIFRTVIKKLWTFFGPCGLIVYVLLWWFLPVAKVTSSCFTWRTAKSKWPPRDHENVLLLISLQTGIRGTRMKCASVCFQTQGITW